MRKISAVVCALLLPSALTHAQPRYRATVIYESPNHIEALGVSADGAVYGGIYSAAAPSVGFTLTNAGLRTVTNPDANAFWVSGANARGTLVGGTRADGYFVAMVGDPATGPHGFRPLGGYDSEARGITADGTIVGNDTLASDTGQYRGFTWRNGIGEMLPLPPGASRSSVQALAASGDPLGTITVGERSMPVRWRNGFLDVLAAPLVTGFATPTAGNRAGGVVGSVWTLDAGFLPVIWSGGTATMLPVPPHSPPTQINLVAVNDRGDILGHDSSRPIVWIDRQPFDLWQHIDNPDGFSLLNAVGIDDAGRIFASGLDIDHFAWAIIALTPINQCGSADFDFDGIPATDADIAAFFACLAGDCCILCLSADFNGDGDAGTDADIEAFFTVLGGGHC